MRTPLRVAVAALVMLGAACDDDDPSDPNGNGDDPELGLVLVAQGLTAPVALVEAPDATGRLFVVEQTGTIRIIEPDGDVLAEPFLDVSDRMVTLNAGYDERGLLGLAFHPDFDSNGLFYVYYSAPLRAGAPGNFNHTSHISEFRAVPANTNTVETSTERIVLQVDQPQSNHNGGTLAFGPDGFLYISLGDGGGADDVGTGHVDDWYAENDGGNAQNVEANLLGKILRIDVDAGSDYGIPAGNPFVGEPGLDEIWAYGFRNPYRMSFDMGGTNMLIVGDAGQNLWEEVSVAAAGGNFGWNVKEGAHCFSTDDPDTSPATCPDEDDEGDPLIDPVIEFANTNQAGGLGVTVVGGYVYRGNDVDDLAGDYIFGVWSTGFGDPEGRVFAATTGGATWPFIELSFANRAGGDVGHYVLGFGQDNEGEVYVLTNDVAGPTGTAGRVYRMDMVEVD